MERQAPELSLPRQITQISKYRQFFVDLSLYDCS